ncbi:MAG: hypothetical protein J6X18_08490 [Bacteroidales bacterium]|nr:hypothetical protein [Bacteroidales bacterium]
MTKGQAIIAEAKKKLVDFITFEAPLLYKKFGWERDEDDENYVITTGDLEPIYINVEVDNAYLDVEDRCYEETEISEVIVSPDGEVWVTNEDGGEWTSDEISVEELANIADAFERAYNRK